MGLFSSFPFGRRHAPAEIDGRTEHVVPQRILQRVLCFTGHTIHDVINDPIARHKVLGYYKLHKQIDRGSEISDLERQWNAPPRR